MSDIDLPDFDGDSFADDAAPPFSGDMNIDDLVAKLENDAAFSDAALADRHGASPVDPQLTINWRELSTGEQSEAIGRLADWVQNWLVRRYNLKPTAIPDCWWKHRDLVEELSALHTAWLAAFDSADAGFGPIGWHERFALALTRKAFHERCAGAHRPDPIRSMPPVDVNDFSMS